MQVDMFDNRRNELMSAADYVEFRRLLIASNCRNCPLHEERENIVVDRGNPASKVLVVGEGPGEVEDLKGLAFVGRAGKLLDKIMDSIGLSTERDMLIGNIVKCRPPGNRAPRSEEARACLPYLEKQIELMKPRVMLLLGATAYKGLLQEKGSFSMEENVGKFFKSQRFPGVELMVLYHPAYLLRDPRKKKEMWAHVKVLKEWMVEEKMVAEKGTPDAGPQTPDK